MKLLSLDLEMAQPSEKIIQIGACVGDTETGEVIDTFCCYVKIDERITPYIEKLTKISDSLLEEKGVTLEEAYQSLVEFAKKHQVFINPLVWGGSDTVELKEQVAKKNPDLLQLWPFGRRWIDAKTVYITYRIANKQPYVGGLAKSLTKLGLVFKGTKHTATDDAINTFFIYKKLLDLIKKEK